MRNFREYDIWKTAMEIAKVVYQITSEFPPSEKYGLASQLQRAAVSIASNIAEGCGRSSPKDFARTLEIALGSCYETETQMMLALEFGYIEQEQTSFFNDNIQLLEKQISSLIHKLRG